MHQMQPFLCSLCTWKISCKVLTQDVLQKSSPLLLKTCRQSVRHPSSVYLKRMRPCLCKCSFSCGLRRVTVMKLRGRRRICFTWSSKVLHQQEKTPERCHFCHLEPASNYQGQLFGSRHLFFIYTNHHWLGAEKPLLRYIQANDPWGWL